MATHQRRKREGRNPLIQVASRCSDTNTRAWAHNCSWQATELIRANFPAESFFELELSHCWSKLGDVRGLAGRSHSLIDRDLASAGIVRNGCMPISS